MHKVDQLDSIGPSFLAVNKHILSKEDLHG